MPPEVNNTPEASICGRFFVTGLQAFLHYGAEVVGLDATQLQQAPSQYLQMAGSTVKSAAKNLALMALGDPIWRQ